MLILQLLKKIASLIREMSDVEFNIIFENIDVSEKEKIVLQRAIQDSKNKAEVIAASLGQKVIGADDINFEYSVGKRMGEQEKYMTKSIAINDIDDLSSKLKNPVKTISKSIDIVWITE